MKTEIEKTIKTLISKIDKDTPPNDAVSISIAVLNLANASHVFKPKEK